MVSPDRHTAAMDKIAALVSVRERSAQETRERLRSCGYSAEESDEAVSTAVRIGLVSDQRFASALIRGKTRAGWGRGKILARLRSAGVADEVIETCSGDFGTPEQEYESALRLLEKRPSRSRDPYASLMRRLVARGFSYETASRAVREYLAR